MSPSPRALIALAVLVVLGMAVRAWREPPPPVATAGELATLDAQRATLPDGERSGAGRAGAGRPRRGARRPAREGAPSGAAVSPGDGERPEPRHESTPTGAIPAEAWAAWRARLPGPGDATGVPAASGPSGTAPPVDVDAAEADALERLPRIGPALARRIVADRRARGPFGSLEGLQRVRGIGPALARALAGRVTFGGRGRP